MRMYVGNLPFSTDESGLKALFEEHGSVTDVKIIMDRETGRPRGFAFVDLDGDDVRSAIKHVHGSEMGGRTLRVNEAHDRPPSRPGPSRY